MTVVPPSRPCAGPSAVDDMRDGASCGGGVTDSDGSRGASERKGAALQRKPFD